MKRIAIAEFRAKNIKENPIVKMYLAYENGYYYHITNSGNQGYRYNSLIAAKEDIKNLWGDWHDFRLLV